MRILRRSSAASLLLFATACGFSDASLPDGRVGDVDAEPGTADAGTGAIHTTLDVAPAKFTAAAAAHFEFHADAEATFTCRLDDQALGPCTSPLDVTVAPGLHLFVVTATGTSGDTAGVVEQAPPIHGWTLDVAAPDTALLFGPAGIDNSATVTFQLGSDESGVTYQCALDGAPPVPCDALWQVGPLADGEHTVTIAAVDAAGNVDPTPLVVTWTIDLSTPDTIIDSAPDGTVGAAPADVTFSSTAGAGANYGCALDGAPFVACTSPWTVADLTTGLHVVQVRVTNAAGTTDPSPATRIWTVDATAPTISLDDLPSDPSIDHTPTFAFSAPTADAVAWWCSVDGEAAPAACTSPWASPNLEYGDFTFRVSADDVFGNRATATYTWRIEPGCGDSIVDVGEICDDGGTVDGDGCSAACDSDETCGNHVTDASVGETCDDGNLTNNDGCYADCQLVDHYPPVVDLSDAPPSAAGFHTPLDFGFTADEPVTWTCAIDGVVTAAACTSPWSAGVLPEGAYTFSLVATDATGNVTTTTYTFTITMWRKVVPATSPAGRLAHGSTFDAARGEVVLFGGSPAGATYSNQMWGWDGTTWTDHTPASSPVGRQYLGLVYAPGPQQVVLYGGSSGTAQPFTMYADTQTWDGSAWTDATPVGSALEGRGFHALAYDSTHDNVVLFGGYVGFVTGPPGYRNDTWLWDGATWTLAPSVQAPSPRFGPVMADDPAHGRVVLFGGHTGVRQGDTWAWDGSEWSQLTPAVSPSPRRYVGMTFDPIRDVVLLFGGQGPAAADRYSDTWALDGDTWTKLSSGGPTGRYMPSFTFDTVHQQGVMFGGWDGTYNGETWIFE